MIFKLIDIDKDHSKQDNNMKLVFSTDDSAKVRPLINVSEKLSLLVNRKKVSKTLQFSILWA